MNSPDLVLPWFTSHWWLLLYFAGFLVLFHVLLLRWVPLSRTGWLKVDYLWLMLALFGVLTQVAATRNTLASEMLTTAQMRSVDALINLRDAATYGTSVAVCHTFLQGTGQTAPQAAVAPTAMSAPTEPARVQNEFDSQCGWYNTLANAITQVADEVPRALNLATLAGPRPAGGNAQANKWLDERVRQYNAAVADVDRLALVHDSSTASKLQLFGPLLIVAAVALRLTRVTADIRFDRSKRAS